MQFVFIWKCNADFPILQANVKAQSIFLAKLDIKQKLTFSNESSSMHLFFSCFSALMC